MAKPLTSWLVPSFSQHNLRLVVSGCCLHVSVTKFQDKFASLPQVNSPYSWNKFQIRCTDMYLIRFVPNFEGKFADLPEFRSSVTTRNIRSPVYNTSKVLNNSSHCVIKFGFGPNIYIQILEIDLPTFPKKKISWENLRKDQRLISL